MSQDRQVLVAPDKAHVRIFTVLATSNFFSVAKSRRDEDLDVLVYQLFTRVARERQKDFVHVANLAALVEQGRPVGQRFQQFLP